MKTINLMTRKVLLSTLFVGFGLTSFAQDGVSDLFKSNQADATKLIEAYLNPFFKGMGTGLNSGWNNTGSPKGFGRFELRFGLTGAIIPDKDKTFDVSQLGLSDNLRLADLNNKYSPTVGGTEVDGPLMKIYNNNVEAGQFNLPKGAALPFVPAPQLQATIGLIKGIDLTLRTLPKIKLGDDAGSVGMFGAGVKVDLIQFIAGKTADKIMPFDLAAALGYTSFKYTLPLDVQTSNSNYTDQKIEAKFSGINLEAIISKKLLFFTPFLSVGYQTANTNLDMKGTYPFQTSDITYEEISNPVQISSRSISGLRTNIGFQFNITFLRLYGSYSLGTYKAFNAGLGIGIGK